VAFFDQYISTSKVTCQMSGDPVLIQDFMGGKVGKFVQLLITFLDGFAVASVQGWLIILTTIPSPIPGRPPQQQLLLCPWR
jgi:ATP-binding cassette, subfamily B (MDR/TAP), member 1